MRIALVTTDSSPLTPAADSDTQSTRVFSLAQALAELGHRVTIYARRDARALPDSAILAPGVTVEHVTAGPPAALAADEFAPHVREFGDHLARRWRRNAPDVVHAHFWTSGLAALAAARDLGIPVVQTFMSLGAADPDGSGPTSDLRNRLESCIAREATAVLASTYAEAAQITRMGVPRSAITVVPCGVDTAQFSPEGPVAKRTKRPRLLAVAPGSLGGRQGLDTLVRALAGVPDAELVIAGGPARQRLGRDQAYQDLVQLARAAGVERRLTFTGRVSLRDLPPLLRSADLVLSAAPYEPAGMLAIAAMACGTPVIASAVSGHQDAVLDGITGVLIPPGQPGLLARRVRQLLAAPVRLEAFGLAAADRAQSRYQWDRIGMETAAAYERCQPDRGDAAAYDDMSSDGEMSSDGDLALDADMPLDAGLALVQPR
jgi:glycosyltransferase involved in cell wall biosynthesis